MQGVTLLLLLFSAALAGGNQTTTYTKARDYLSITSENYPMSYPGPDSWSWQWRVDGGLWAVVFLDFQLACGQDRLLLSSPRKNLTFTCGSAPAQQFAYFTDNPHFTLRLISSADSGPMTRKFKCQVLYGTNKEALQSRIYDMYTQTGKNTPTPGEESSPLSTNLVIIILLLIIIPLVVIIVIAAVVMLLRRRQLQQSTNTSLHFSIGAIRRDSSVSYTRHGNGPPAGARSRLDSQSSLPGDTASRPSRPVKRSESNASWAMRAERSHFDRTGSCSSEGQHGGTTSVPNVYTPCPGDSVFSVSDGGLEDFRRAPRGQPASWGRGLSTILEETSSGSKVGAAFPVPLQPAPPRLSTDHGGYLLMTSCSASYANCGHD